MGVDINIEPTIKCKVIPKNIEDESDNNGRSDKEE